MQYYPQTEESDVVVHNFQLLTSKDISIAKFLDDESSSLVPVYLLSDVVLYCHTFHFFRLFCPPFTFLVQMIGSLEFFTVLYGPTLGFHIQVPYMGSLIGFLIIRFLTLVP